LNKLISKSTAGTHNKLLQWYGKLDRNTS